MDSSVLKHVTEISIVSHGQQCVEARNGNKYCESGLRVSQMPLILLD
jgi:hypothetical protein